MVLIKTNIPIQIYWKFYHQKKKTKIDKKYSDIFHISAQNIDCGYSLEPPRRGGSEPPRRGGSNEYPQVGSNEYPQSMFWAEIWKISEFFI